MITVKGLGKKAVSKVPEMPLDEDDPMYLEHPEKLEEDRKAASIPLIELLKHYPYHNADYTVWLDREFGEATDGFTMIKDLDIGKAKEYLEPLLEVIPDLTQVVEMEGKGFTRQIGLTTDVTKAKKLKEDICKHPKLEVTLTRDTKAYDVEKVRMFVKDVKEGKV